MATDDVLARQLAGAVRERARGPLLQRTSDTAAQALKDADYKTVNRVQLMQWLNKTTGSGRERIKNSAKHGVTIGDLEAISTGLAALYQAEVVVVEPEPEIDYTTGWTSEAGELTTLKAGAKTKARADLVTLISECAGNIHSAKIGTVVGGTEAKGKGVKKVAGLHNPSARIDRQNPPSGQFNVQFQVGEASLSGVIFAPADPKDLVLSKLLVSYDGGQMARSPRAPR